MATSRSPNNLQILSLFFTFLLLLLQSANSISFKITRFDSGNTDIFYEGDARAYVGAVEFNSLSYLCRVGRAIYANRVRLWNSDTNQLSDFTTHFSFSVDTLDSARYAAGIAFYIAPVGFQIPPNSAGGFLGLFNTTTSDSSQNQVVHVEFDSFANPEWDPPVPHVGINKNSIASAVYTPWNASVHSGDTIYAWINYNATTRNLSVSWTYQKTYTWRENSTLSYHIDLMKILPEWITVGFSAATSHLVERHQLLSWEFTSSLDSEETNGKKVDKKKVEIGIGIAVSVGAMVAGVSIVFCILRKRKYMQKVPTEEINLASMNDDLERGAGPKRFSYEDLILATRNFSKERKLGEGGFGAVYKGYLMDLDMSIAVKKISRGSKQGRKEYITEVKIISQLRHRNLVQLIGWCHDKGEFLLVYEFMLNGSLDGHLFGNKSTLTWDVRCKISLGLASALLYLHEEWEQCVVHRDIKSSNVMLDSSFNAKLGDFGLARLIDHEVGPQTATGLAGTLGYMAPEYISTGRASKESDVYSFGIVALEIATGRKAVDPLEQQTKTTLVQWVWELYGDGDLLSAVDQRLHSFDETQVACLMIVGLWCAHPDSTLRPSIRQAIQVLNFEAPLPNVPEKMPVPVYRVPAASVGSTEPSITVSSLDVGR
ncbi:putative Kinase [Melia azedarach]|uniref:Kinase n=1 Tax=Melia azedarach TaxID=155640 RepID=A0ACC1XV48_MELAZ|nr:putative Kinase [Melia azedarach]